MRLTMFRRLFTINMKKFQKIDTFFVKKIAEAFAKSIGWS